MTAFAGAAPARIRLAKAAANALAAMAIKAGGALLAIAVFTLAARRMAPDDFGHLAIAFNAISFLAVVAVLGQETLIARSFGEYAARGQLGLARAAHRFGWRATLLSGAVFALAFAALAPLAGVARDGALAAGAAFLLMQALLHYSSHATRAIAGFAASEANRELTWRIVLLAGLAVAAQRQAPSETVFFSAAAAGMALSLALQALATRRALIGAPIAAPAGAERAEWLRRSRAMWLSAVVEAASQYADVVLVGYFATPAAAGGYFAATRIANVFAMVSAGLHAYSVGQCARLFFSGEARRLQEILNAIAVVAMALLAPALALALYFGPQALAIFGARFAADYPTLAILAGANFCVALCGPAAGILLTTGHERLYARLVAAATPVRLGLSAVLAAKYGALGAAIGWAAVSAPMALGLAALCRRLCGVDPSVTGLWRAARR